MLSLIGSALKRRVSCMERELSIGVELAIGLVALAVVLSLTMGFVYYGNIIKDGSGSQFVDMKETMSLDYMKGLARGETDTDMPSATAYNIIRTYESVISEEVSGFDITVRVPSVDGSVLKDNLKGRVKLEVYETSDSSFVVIVNKVDRSGAIVNNTEIAINQIRAKYGL